MIELLETERILENASFKLYLCKKMTQMMTEENCFLFFELSKIFKLDLLVEYINNYILRKYLTKTDARMFRQLSYNDLQTLVSSSELHVDSELEIFYAAADWVEYNPSEREHLFEGLLKLVRLPLLSEEILVGVVQAHPLCSKNFECINIISKALEIKKDVKSCSSSILLQNRHYSRKIENINVMFIGGEDLKDNSFDIAGSYVIDTSTIKKVKTTSSMKFERFGCKSFAIGSNVYCFAGDY